MKKTLLILAVAMLSVSIVKAQSDPVVMEIDGRQIRQSEFMIEFTDNIGQQLNKKPGVTALEKQAAIEEYADLYAIFRAKELDAHNLGFDTMPQMLSELAMYRKDLAAPYLLDSAVLQRILSEAYERNHYSLHAAHILIPVNQNAAPEDTLKAYNRACDLRKRIENGEDFNTVAGEEALRRNPQAKPRPIEGDLGYFTVFDMVYPFENAAYALHVGEVSQPVRTRYGYHIIKLLDRVEGLFGKITMAHIWLHTPDSSTNGGINLIYQQLMDGTPFEMAARQSDDRTTSEKGGVLADATLSQLPPEYIHQLVGMKEGDISKPFHTQYGWHIIKLIKKDDLPQAEDLASFYKQRLSRDQRGDASRKTFAANKRRQYNIIDCTVTPAEQPKGRKKKGAPVKMMASLDELNRHVPDSVLKGKWNFDDSEFTDQTPLVITPAKQYTSLDVAHYIRDHQKLQRKGNTNTLIANQYSEFLDSVTIDYADSQLEKEYPDFAEIVNDYRRGLIIFNYNDKMIWRKAILDTAGFVDFYQHESRMKRLDNPEDSIFFYYPRARMTLITVSDSTAITSDKAKNIVAKVQQKGLGSNAMKNALLKKINRKKYPADNIVETDVELVEQYRQDLLSPNQWQRGIYVKPSGKGYRLLVVEEILPRSLKELSDARGYYLNAWQNEVERQLNEELLSKYNVKINRDVIRSIKY